MAELLERPGDRSSPTELVHPDLLEMLCNEYPMKLATRAILGLGVGVLLLWLAVSQVDMEGAASTLSQARAGLSDNAGPRPRITASRWSSRRRAPQSIYRSRNR
jgi:hypothetical protein